LHCHPFDVVPLLAFADNSKDPPVIFVNHADHVFWISIAVTDTFAQIRQSGLTLSQRRRGIDEERCALLPIPLTPVTRMLTRSQAKRELGISDDVVVLLSIAAKNKYEPIWGEMSFVEAVLPVLRQYPNAILLVVGSDAHGHWKKATDEFPDRIKAYGTREDTQVFYQAADVYLDSFPLASLTSLLEAGAYGTPLVSYARFADVAGVLRADCPGFSATLLCGDNPESYRSSIGALIENPNLRIRIGDETQKAILSMHAGIGWQHLLHDLYRHSAVVPPRTTKTRDEHDPPIEYLDLRLAAIRQESSEPPSPENIISHHVGLLPLSMRMRFWATRFHGRLALLPECLLSQRVHGRLRKKISDFKTIASQTINLGRPLVK
jgi:hypothetical protein